MGMKFSFNSRKTQKDFLKEKDEPIFERNLLERRTSEPNPEVEKQAALLKILHFKKLKKDK